ncbi:MAG: helix-turn-helix domain-containing protein [Sphaerochaeta sp.]|jgi:transcriptional regulator with XRE-family HTH domain|nr:helix-turn-helix domain-containing protein [Sphaerochaeta sp.]
MKRERITKREIEAVKRVYHNGDIPARILAAEIGVSENAFYRWLSGSRTPGYLVTARIRQFLKKHTFSDHADRPELKIEKGEVKAKTDKRIAAINRYVEKENMRVETVASQIGVTARTVYNWIDGKSRISPLASPRVDMFLRRAPRLAQINAAERAESLLGGK